MITASLTGDKKLDRKLSQLKTRTARRAISAGIRASLKPCVAAIKANVNAATASSSMKRSARQLVKSTAKRVKTGEYSAKAGFAVGKQTKARRRRAHARHLAGLSGKAKGVGVSASNIHWFVLGTKERTTKRGHPTGRIKPIFQGVIKDAFASSQAAMMLAARLKISTTIQREARRP